MRSEFLQKLDKLPFFTLEALKSQLRRNPMASIKYNLKKGKIFGLKRGFYVTSEFVKRIKYQGQLEDYLEFVATKLISPSYLSLEYMLSKYAILSESPFVLTLITTKTPRVVQNQLATFSYINVKEELFCGFESMKKGEFVIKLATKAKALFDFLYLKKRTFKTLNQRVLKELRLNLEELNVADWREFEDYLVLAKSKKMEKLLKLLKTL